MLKYKFIGWCHDPTFHHDKVWGVIYIGDQSFGSYNARKCLSFWGRRGKKLQTKVVNDNWELVRLIDSKRGKGYLEINKDRLDLVYPEFETDLEKTVIWATLLQ